MSADIGFLARFAYDTGMTPLDYAEVNVIRAHVDAFLNPGAFPGEVNPATAALACRILGDLLDAGWTPPALEPAARAVLDRAPNQTEDGHA